MLEKMQNIGIMAHIDAGKTTTTERMLFYSGKIHKIGEIDDGAVAVLCAIGEVQPQTEMVWKQANEYKVPRICFVNKMDRLGADFFAAMESVGEKFKVEVAPLQIPIGS